MNNLHRELAPISAAAWAQIDEQVATAFRGNIVSRRFVDVAECPVSTAAVPTGHRAHVRDANERVYVRRREGAPVVELRVLFTLDRESIDEVELGGRDGQWQPAADAAATLAVEEDRLVLDGSETAGVVGLRAVTGKHTVEAADYPEVVARAVTELRAAGVAGPYALLLNPDDLIEVERRTEDGLVVARHLERVLEGELLSGAGVGEPVVVSTRGGDFTLHLAEDVAVGYLGHDDTTVRLYVEEAFAFTDVTGEAAVLVRAGGRE
jgi:uncharacterized linocin/CFP29 family protein